VLQDRVDPKPFPAVERVIRQELGAGAEELFAEFDHAATAAASLAQASCGCAPGAVVAQYQGCVTMTVRLLSESMPGSNTQNLLCEGLTHLRILSMHNTRRGPSSTIFVACVHMRTWHSVEVGMSG
jgi:hypothetical protein